MKYFLLFCALFGLGTAMASDLDFTLVNHTSRSFEGVYITATSNKDWDVNLLPDGKALAAGGKLKVKFSAADKSGTWDLNLVDSEGVSEQFKDVNLVHADTVTLEVVDGKITAEVE